MRHNRLALACGTRYLVRMTSSARPIEIGLLWHSARSGNLGVGALTVGNMAFARAAARAVGREARFTIIGSRDTGRPYIEGPDIRLVELDTRTLLSPRGYWRALAGLDCVLDIGGGDSFADIYGAKRFGFLWLTKLGALLRGKPLLLSPQTIGPFSRQPYRALAAFAMARAAAVVARDPLSFDVARAMVPSARVVQSVDVAFALPFSRRPKRADGRIAIGVNVSGLLCNGGYAGGNEYGLDVDYEALMRAFIGELVTRPDVAVSLVTHVNAPHMPSDDDGAAADRFAAMFPGVERVPDFASPSEAKSWISGLDFLVAGRMHACIAAFSSGVPVVPVAYSRKFSGLFEGMLGYSHLVPVKGLDTEAALAFLLDRLARRDELARAIADGNARVDVALGRYRAELERLFRTLP